MSKVGILTFHSGQNFGASLQCYAMMQTILKLGHDVETINFRKEKVYGSSKLKSVISPRRLARVIYELPYKVQLTKKEKLFDEFIGKQILQGRTDVVTEDSIAENANAYTTIVFGSDQIWNLDERVYDRSKVFFGDFVFSGKKVAVSASFGDSIKLAEENEEYIIERLKKFDRISVREESGREYLEKRGITAENTVDPTLLLSADDWYSLITETPIVSGKYIFYYSVNCRKYSWQIAKELSKQTGLPVINLVAHPKIVGAGFRNRYATGPIEFLNIIKNAEYVVTNSFHGTAFSIIFEKKFIPVFDEIEGKMKMEERKYDVLEKSGLLSLITKPSDGVVLDRYESIDFDLAKKKLGVFIENSISYIDSALK